MNKLGKFQQMGLLAMVTILIVALALAGCASPAAPGQASSGYLDTVTTTGTGEAYGKPDKATIQFGYTASDEDVGVALNQANDAIEQITAALTSIGIAEADIQTTYFSVWPEDKYEPMTGIPTGQKLYRVENTLSVVMRDITQVAAVIQTGLDSGANNVYGLSFGIDDSSAIAAEARTAAVADARNRAEQLAQELGAQLGEARMASETYGNSGFPQGADYALGMGGGGAPPISEGQLTINVQVNVTFDLVR
ncbi:MAG: DUF541 domain-containing protein [Anaerolineales bacterium]|nr:MAG: DUF541 domain-containing protein [Anaerolineales bacterium]